MALPLIIAGVAARAAAKKVATNAVKKSAAKAAKAATQKSKTAQVAKNSVKVIEPMPRVPNRAKDINKYITNKTNNAKSGKAAADKAKDIISRVGTATKKPTVKINATTKNSKTTTKSNYKTPSLAKTQAKGIAKLAGAGVATGAFTQVPAVKQSIKRQVEQANKNKKRK